MVFRVQPKRSFLLLKHSDRWDVPKGHVDPEEPEIQCALRELREETAIAPDSIALDPQFRFVHRYWVDRGRKNARARLKELIVFLAELTRATKIRVSEHEGYRWFDWNPPHKIQSRTIDPLLSAVEKHWQTQTSSQNS